MEIILLVGAILYSHLQQNIGDICWPKLSTINLALIEFDATIPWAGSTWYKTNLNKDTFQDQDVSSSFLYHAQRNSNQLHNSTKNFFAATFLRIVRLSVLAARSSKTSPAS